MKDLLTCYINITFVLRISEFAFFMNESKNERENVFTSIRMVTFKESEVKYNVSCHVLF